jgi:pyrrolysyl-tRNA synthetase-like protein
MSLMRVTFSLTQGRRLRELDVPEADLEREFEDASERDRVFQEIEKEHVEENRKQILRLRDGRRRPAICELETRLIEALTSIGFVQVVTPILLSKAYLEKMSITAGHPLTAQVFWVGEKRCLRPMLAPHLYRVMKSLLRPWGKPVRIFEVGPCFRKESKGRQHLEEFTMLNLVELGLPEDQRNGRMEELAGIVMKAAGISDYRMIPQGSEVYGETIDVMSDGHELGSCAMGPHPLDGRWGIVDPWVGLGFGLERTVMVLEKYRSVGRVGRSFVYLDGNVLNL